MGWNMEIENLEDKVLIRQKSRQKNEIEFDSTKDLSCYNRRDLANYELFLREKKQFQIAENIKLYLGKIIRARECDDLLIADGNYRINMFLEDIKGRIERDVREYGLNLNPDFQRAHVWNMEQRILYVEFLLKGGKSNPIYFNHEGWMKSFQGEYVIVDGKQRLTSILMFLENEFPVFKDKDSEGIGFYAREFDMIPNDIEFIINDLPNRKLVLQWYLQMNKGNVAHTKEELEKVESMILALE